MSHGGGTPNLNLSQQNQGDMKVFKTEGSPSGGAAVPKALGGRSTKDSMPVHETSMGFMEGGDRGITNIEEEDDGV